MKPSIYSRQNVEITPVPGGPCISITIHFDPKMIPRLLLKEKLKQIYDSVKQRLAENYSASDSKSLLKKLENVLITLDYGTYKKSVAIFLSTSVRKVMYMNIEVEDKVTVSQYNTAREIIQNKEQQPRYLLMLLTSEKMRILYISGEKIQQVAAKEFRELLNPKKNTGVKTTNLTLQDSRKEVLNIKFLHQIDGMLDNIFLAYSFPLFLAGENNVTGHFKKLSKHHYQVAQNIAGINNQADNLQLLLQMQPYIAKWQKTKDKYFIQLTLNAIKLNKCATGIRKVFDAANEKKGKLLLVEKNYFYPSFIGEMDEWNPMKNPISENYIYVKDVVDDVIEKVLDYGGDVEFVEEGILTPFEHIALHLMY